jgi:WhiB family redox-sensing transcriptional regulator
MSVTLDYSVAKCATVDPEAFSPMPTDFLGIEVAKDVCGSCPIKEKCLQFALDAEDFSDVVFGGMTGLERAAHVRKKARVRSYVQAKSASAA